MGTKKSPATWLDELAFHVAQGGRIAKWSRILSGECSERQARRYSIKPEFKALVREHRAEIVRATLGTHTLLAEAATAAALHMIKHSASEGVKVAIYRAVVGSQIALDSHVDLLGRVTALEAAQEHPQPLPAGIRPDFTDLEDAHEEREKPSATSPPAPSPGRSGAKRRGKSS
jgi:hypothetical protein